MYSSLCILLQNLQWSFGFNRNIPVVNLTDEHRKMIAYCCAHTGVLYDFANNKQYLLQGHVRTRTTIRYPIANSECYCVSKYVLIYYIFTEFDTST